MKWIFISLGGLSVFSGIITFWLPIPIGLPLIILGLALVGRHSPTAQRLISDLLDRFPWIRTAMRRFRGRGQTAPARESIRDDGQNRS